MTDVKRELTDAEIEELGSQEAERKEFCPNCEAVVPCTHEAELFVCDICGEDFAKYIVSRNCNVSDVSMTQDILTPIKTSQSNENTNPDYYKHDAVSWISIATRIQDKVFEIQDLKAELAELRERTRWIPVSENPTKSDWYLIMYQGYRVPDADYYDVEAGWLSDIPIPDYWMPMPEPPEVV
jgi:hypothetical protein